MSADERGVTGTPRQSSSVLAVAAVLLGLLAALHPVLAVVIVPLCVGGVLLWRSAPLTLVLASLSVLVPYAPLSAVGFGLDDVVPLVVAAFGAFHVLRRAGKNAWAGPYLIPFLVLLASGVVSAFVNAESAGDLLVLALKSVFRNAISLVIVLLAYTLSRTHSARKWLLRSLILVAVIESTFGILAYATNYKGPFGVGVITVTSATGEGGNLARRVVGTISTPGAGGGANFLAGYLALHIPLTIGWALSRQTKWSRLLASAAAALQTVCLALTYTRASVACVLLGVLAMIVLYGGVRLLYKWVPALALAAGSLLAVVPGLADRILAATFSERTVFWSTALHVLVQHPIAGVGSGRYLATLAQMPVQFWRQVGTFSTSFNPHNAFLFYGVELGVAALVAIGWLAALSLFLGWQAWRELDPTDQRELKLISLGIVGGLFAFLCNNMFASLIHLPSVGVYFWLFCGIVWRFRELARREKVSA